MDNTKFQYEGMKWLMELELLDHPQAVNTIKLNIMMTSDRIKEVELLIYRENKSMLVLLDLTWIGRKFFKQRIFSEVQDILVQMLPSFKFRVTDNPEIMKMAIERVKKALTGGNYESALNTSNVLSSNSNQSSIVSETHPVHQSKAEQGTSESSSPSEQEPSEAEQSVQNGAGTDNPEEK